MGIETLPGELTTTALKTTRVQLEARMTKSCHFETIAKIEPKMDNQAKISRFCYRGIDLKLLPVLLQMLTPLDSDGQIGKGNLHG